MRVDLHRGSAWTGLHVVLLCYGGDIAFIGIAC
jgi:hypothetical protein